MQKLIVRNFGPIKELDLEIKDLMLFIGEQATGKSTVAKLVYFFRKEVKNTLISYLYSFKSYAKNGGENWVSSQILSDILFKFHRLFGEIENSTVIDFKFRENLWLRIIKEPISPYGYFAKFSSSYIEKKYNDKEDEVIWEFFDKVSELIFQYRQKFLGEGKNVSEFDREEKRSQIIKEIASFFGEDADREIIFIPSGRGALAIFSEHIPSSGWGVILEDFRNKIAVLRHAFRTPLNQIIERRKNTGINYPSEFVINLMTERIKKILKGEYRVDEEGEKIYFDEENFVKVSMASSGQQESLWILLQLFVHILNQEKVFLIIEEPEAHLFPKAQKSLVELITLLFNENNSQVLITTHSPYILTAFNNLIYAGNVGQEHHEAGDVIPKLLWIDHEKAGAYRLHDGIAEDLMDEESHLIRVEEIDTVSQSINQDFDTLLNLELQ
jgi:AAA15 family ATPase/GTPase